MALGQRQLIRALGGMLLPLNVGSWLMLSFCKLHGVSKTYL